MLLFVILVLVLSIPAVQTSLGKKATDTLNKDFGTNITIAKVGLQFNGDVELKDVYVEDHKQDTLFHIDELNTSILSFKKLYDNKLTFGDIDIYDLTFNLKTYKDEKDTNLDVFVAKFDDDAPKKEKSDFLLSSSDVSIEGGTFKLSDENKETTEILQFNDLNINATNFLILGPDVSARINKLAFVDDRGVEVKNMTTNFTYTREQMLFDYLQIKTENSTLKGKLQFDYKREDLQYFVDKVKVTANFEDSNIALDDLNAFYNEFGVNQNAKLSTSLYGTLNDLTASQLILSTSRNTIVDGNINFKNLFNKEDDNFIMDGKFNKLSSTYKDLKALLPNVLGNSLPSTLDHFDTFTITGNARVTSKTVDADIEVLSKLGIIITDLHLDKIDNIDDASYNGNVILDEFNLGILLNDPMVGNVSLNLDVDGNGFTVDKLNTQVKGDLYSFGYNNYEYFDTKIEGNVQNKIFNGKLVTNDENIDLKFNGLVDFSQDENIYDFTADVGHVNLNALNFVTRDSISVFKGYVKMDMKGTSLDDAHGNIHVKNSLYRNQNSEYKFNDFAVSSTFIEDIRYIEVNSPDIINGSIRGKFIIQDLPKLLENSLGDIYTNYKPHEIGENQYLDFNFNIYNKIAAVFYPNLKLGANTFIKGRIESNAKKFNLTFKSPNIKLNDFFANQIQLRLNNDNPLFNTYVEVDSISSKFYDVSKFSLINVTLNDTLYIKTGFKGGKQNRDDYDLNLFYTINEESKSVLGFKKSTVNFKNNEWFVNEEKNSQNKIVFDRLLRDINIDNLKMSHKNEEILLNAQVLDSTYKNIDLDFKDVDLVKITPTIDSLKLNGNVNGKLNVLHQDNVYLPESNVTIDNFKVNDFNLGSFKANIIGNESLTNYSVDVSLKEDSNESLSVKGNLNVAGKDPSLDLDINFNKFILNPLNPFGEGVITRIRGEVAGNARVTGRLQHPQINGELILDDGGLAIPYLNVDYEFEDDTRIALEKQSFIFNNADMIDVEHFSRAKLSGNINHVNFSNWSLGLNINSERLLVLNTEDSEDALYFGKAFVNGDIDISGPTDQLFIEANVSSEEGTVFKIPMSDTEALGENSFVHFLSPEEKYAKNGTNEVALENVKGLEMEFNLDISENAQIEIILDRDTGSIIKGNGNGSLLAQINTNGKFNMYGDFIVSQGDYNFVYGSLVRKNFEVVPGGTLAWEGDPLRAEINIKALHKGISANPSVLLDNPINQSIPVEVEIHLTEQLEKPNLDFEIRFPSVNSTLNTELNDRLRDKDKREFQAMSLLATGSFRSELAFDSSDVYGLVSDGVTSMLNELFADDENKVKLGLDLDLGKNTPDYETDSKVAVTLSTKLSDRILVNGKVGVPVGGVSESTVAGDFEVQVLLNEDRTLSLKFFNRENSIQNFGEQIGYTQGVGLSYNIEFDNLKELLQKMFKNNKKKKASIVEEKKVESSDNGLPEHYTFKQKDSTKTKKIKKN
ncbi:translocation/assembly module TamB domain-containing protein [Pontimicrobium sp. IMCC45349]|uniref:translocation/assembly module TamB domain-containing protein n=1 Tax=Pontimicrobium sp. IMCC45349 TaxID=3391574 RepID=UPI00399EEC02